MGSHGNYVVIKFLHNITGQRNDTEQQNLAHRKFSPSPTFLSRKDLFSVDRVTCLVTISFKNHLFGELDDGFTI